METPVEENAGPKIHSKATGGFGERFACRMIDAGAGLVFGGVGGVVGAVAAAVLAAMGAVPEGWLERLQAPNVLASTLWGLLASLLYHSVSEGVGGTSLGKLSLGYRVIGEDSKPCGFGAAALRSLAYFADAFFFGIPAYQSMKDNPNNQRLGDKWAKTIVIKASAAPASAVRSSGLVAVGLMGGMAAHVTVMAISVIAKVL